MVWCYMWIGDSLAQLSGLLCPHSNGTDSHGHVEFVVGVDESGVNSRRGSCGVRSGALLGERIVHRLCTCLADRG